MRKLQRNMPVIIVALAMILCVAAQACPSCKEAYAPGSKEASIGESYSYSVVFFLGMFFSLLFGGSAFISWKIKQALRLRTATSGIENQ